MKKIIVTVLAVLILCGIAAFAENAAGTPVFTEGEKNLLFEQDGVVCYLTGAVSEQNGLTLLEAAVENDSDKEISILTDLYVNGWTAYKDTFISEMMGVVPGTKVKCSFLLDHNACEISGYEDIEEIIFTFELYDDYAAIDPFAVVESVKYIFNAGAGEPAATQSTETGTSADSVFPLLLGVQFGDSLDEVKLKEDEAGNKWHMDGGLLTADDRTLFGIPDVSYVYSFESDHLNKLIYYVDMVDKENTAYVYYDSILSAFTSLYGAPNGAGVGVRTSEYTASQAIHELAALIPGASSRTLHDNEWYFECGAYTVKIDFIMNYSDNKSAGTCGYSFHLCIEAFGDLEAAGNATEPLIIEGVSQGAEAGIPRMSYTTLRNGSKGDDVVTLQNALAALGYLSGSIDGDFGPGTENAVKAFQADHGLAANGIADQTTLEALYGAEN